MLNHFQKELEKLKKHILHLGALVEERVRLAAKAVESKEIYDSERIIKTDYEVDEQEVEIEEECLKVLALHQPVAVDLRFIITTIKINSELERIGDEAVNIARRMKTATKMKNNSQAVFDYSFMIDKVQAMLKKSLDSLVTMDIDEAFKVLTMDDDVDDQYVEKYELFKSEIKKYPDHAEYLTNMFLIARHMERIGDHATNIAEEVIYLIEGEIVRHGNY